MLDDDGEEEREVSCHLIWGHGRQFVNAFQAYSYQCTQHMLNVKNDIVGFLK